MRVSTCWRVALVVAAAATMATVGTPLAGAAAGDTTPPSVPQNARISGEFRGEAIITWDPSSDDSGSINYYWVLVDGQQRARPRATTYSIDTLVQLCRITPGQHTISVLAVDASLNRSGSSNQVAIVVG